MPRQEAPRLDREQNKRKGFVGAMDALSALLPRPNAQVLRNCYAGLRPVDNIVDGDARVPEGYASAEEYVLRRRENLAEGRAEDMVDRYLHDAQDAAREAGFSIRDELELMLTYFVFDARRVGTWRAFPRAQLEERFFSRDTLVCTRVPLMAFGEDARHARTLAPLAEAVRVGYDSLRDLRQDLAKGQVNIPLEDMARLGIGQEALTLENPLADAGMRAWRRGEARRGLALLKEYRRGLREASLKPLTRTTLLAVYEVPAYARFVKELARS